MSSLVNTLPTLLLTASPEASEASASNGSAILVAVLLSLMVIYLASKVGGELCSRINLPPVLGELLGGVVVGVSALHLLVFPESGLGAENSLLMQAIQAALGLTPDAVQETFAAQSEVISVLAELGVIILLFEIGLESDLSELIRVGPQAAIVAVVGVTVPFVAGTLGLLTLFHVPTVPAIFAGAALTATSIGITAKVLSEIRQLSSSEGQIIIGAAVLDDVLGIIILAVVSSLAKTGEVQVGSVVYLIGGAGVFLVGSIVVGRLVSPLFMDLVKGMQTRGNLLVASLVVMLALAFVGAAIQLEAILGAFTAGLILAETDRAKELEEQVLPLADFLVPIFFVCVGAKTDLSVLNPAIPANREGLVIAAFLIVVAILGKVTSGFAVWGGATRLNQLAIGVGMVPRGEVGLVFAAAGSDSGVLPPALDVAIVVMVIITTFVAPPLLRLVFPKGDPTAVAAAVPEPPSP